MFALSRQHRAEPRSPVCRVSLSNLLRINNSRVERLRLQFGHTQGFALRMSRLSDLAGGATR